MPKQQQKKRHAPLGQVLLEDDYRSKYVTGKAEMKTYSKHREEEDEEELLDEKTSAKIFKLSREQLEEEEEKAATVAYNNNDDDDDSDDEDDDNESISVNDNFISSSNFHVDKDSEGYVTLQENEGLTEAEERLVQNFTPIGGTEQRKTLADIIMEKIREKEEMEAAGMTPQQIKAQEQAQQQQHESGLPEKVVKVYTEIGKILSRYTAGKLPKAFKVIPSLANWEEVLYLTRPDRWSPQAMYAATRIFASNLNPKMAQRFYYLVLLDAVRADIHMNKKLNYHYYMSLKKSIYKPAAFFKGILLPLCKEECTLREAAIVSSVLQKVSIPVHHSAVAIHKLAQMDYTGATSIFMKTLLNKKYSLPAPVIGSVVTHFASFINDNRELPVLWHQCLLVFVQRYKNVVTEDAREALKAVMKDHFHHKITPEIRRELFGQAAYNEERSNLGGNGAGGAISVAASNDNTADDMTMG